MVRDDGVLHCDAYVDVILGHHKFYNNSGGYPEDFDIESSSNRIMIDIISVADSLDAATDDILKTHNKVKSLNMVCEEIIAEAGVRYSPVVASALENQEVKKSLARILTHEREEAYYTAYHYAWSQSGL